MLDKNIQTGDPSERTVQLNDAKDARGDTVIYVMSRDQRTQDNWALLHAQQYALDRDLALVVLFNVYPHVPNRTRNHYDWMFTGLEEVEGALAEHDIPFVVEIGSAKRNIVEAAQRHNAAAVFFDFSPLRGPTAVREAVARRLAVPCFVTDTHNIIPVWVTSNKQEWAAHTIRRKIHRRLPDWLEEPPPLREHPHTTSRQRNDWRRIRDAIDAPLLPDYTPLVEPGERAGRAVLHAFLRERLHRYSSHRNDPNAGALSNISAYLHYGNISGLRVALEAQAMIADTANERAREGVASYLEELTVRKELADNFCYYNPHYDSFEGIPDWAQKTLTKHQDDPRPHEYSLEQLEAARTGDAAWNAAQIEMMRTGKMHGYMRIYWAKMILAWTPDPHTAIAYTIALNDKYSLDGYDPNGYTNILWSVGGLHDRPWKERPIYGTIRYMNADGLRRKFDLDAYVKRWNA